MATLTHLATSIPQSGTNICRKQFRAVETQLHLPGCVPCTVHRARPWKGAVPPCPVWHRHPLLGPCHRHGGHNPTTAGVRASARAYWGTASTKYPWKTNLEKVQQTIWCGKQGFWWFFDKNDNTVHSVAELRTPGRAAFSIPAFRTGKMGRGAPGILLNVFPSAVKAGSSTLACLLWTAMGYTGAKGGPERDVLSPKVWAILCAQVPSQWKNKAGAVNKIILEEIR